MEHASEQDLNDYLREHPRADPTRHTVKGEKIDLSLDYHVFVTSVVCLNLDKAAKSKNTSGGIKNPLVIEHLEGIRNAFISFNEVEQEKEEKNGNGSKAYRRFIVCFKEDYYRVYGFEYETRIASKHISMIKTIIEKLNKNGMKIEDYIRWYFSFLQKDENEKFNPADIGKACNTWLFNEYKYARKGSIQNAISDSLEEEERTKIRAMAMKLREKYPKDKELENELKSFDMRRYSNGSFRQYLADKSRQLNRKKRKKKQNGKKTK